MLHKEQWACVSFFHEVEMSSTQRVWPNLSFMKGICFFLCCLLLFIRQFKQQPLPVPRGTDMLESAEIVFHNSA